MTFRVRTRKKRKYIALHGELYSQDLTELYVFLTGIDMALVDDIIIDIAGIDHLCFKSVGLLTEKLWEAYRFRSRCRIVNIGAKYRHLFAITDSVEVARLHKQALGSVTFA